MNSYILLAIICLFLIVFIKNIFNYKNEDGYILTFIGTRNLVYFLIILVLVIRGNEWFLSNKDRVFNNKISLEEKINLIDMTKNEKSRDYLREIFNNDINISNIEQVKNKIGELNKISS